MPLLKSTLIATTTLSSSSRRIMYVQLSYIILPLAHGAFLQLYEPLVVGKFCEARDPYLAYIAYAKGLCDDELIAITNDNSMFKQQARYLIKRRQPDLWAQVLVSDNVHRRALIDQVRSKNFSRASTFKLIFSSFFRLFRLPYQSAQILMMSQLPSKPSCRPTYPSN